MRATLICCIFMMVSSFALAKEPNLTAAEKEWLKQHPVINLGVDPDWPPFEYIDSKGDYSGMAADFMKLVSERLGVTFHVTPNLSWPQVISAAKSKQVALLPAVMSSEEREAYLIFTRAYLDFPMVIVVRQGTDSIDSLDDLNGKVVSVVRNYVTHELLAAEHKQIILQPADTVTKGLKDLSTGDVDAYVGNLASISHAIQETGVTNLKIVARTSYSYPLGIGVRNDWPELARLLEKALDSISKEERNLIIKKWVNAPLEYTIDPALILEIGIPVLAVIFTFFLVSFQKNKRLRHEITERKKSERKYRRLFETAKDTIFILDGDCFIDCNPSAPLMFGCRREDLINRSPADFSPYFQPDGRSSKDVIKQLLVKARAGVPQQFDWQHKTLNGKLFDASVIVNTIEYDEKIYLQAIVRNVTEGKKAERELAHLLREHESVTNNIPDILYKTDIEGRFVWWNKSLEEVTGLTHSQLYHQSTFKVICQDDIPVVRSFINNVMQQGYDAAEYHLMTTEGPVLYQVKSIALKNEFGDVIGRTGIARDISQQRKLESALKSIAERTTSYTGKEFFNALVENLARTLNVKFAFVAELVDADKQIMRTIVQWYDGKVMPNIEYGIKDTPCKNVLDKQACVYTRGVQALFPKDQILVEMGVESYAGIPILDSFGEPLGIISVLDDKPLGDELVVRSVINDFAVRARVELEREKADAKLRQSAAVFENSDEGFMITDVENNIVAVNPAFTSITGYTEKEVLGKNPRFLQSGRQSSEFYANLWKSLKENGKWQGEIWNKRKSGEEYPEWLTISLIKNEYGEVVNHVGVFDDMTARVEADKRQRDLQKQLQQAQKMEAIGQLAGGIAHDFNNILASMLGYTDLARSLKYEDESGKLGKYLDEVKRAGDRAKHLVGQMLTFSRGSVHEEKMVMQLGSIVDDTVNMLRPMLPSSIEINKTVAKDLPAVNADQVQLHQLIMNLCINARDAMGEKGRLDINLSLATNVHGECSGCHKSFSGNFVQLAVSDSGAGIEASNINQLFEPFFTTKEMGKGSGMGLSVVHGIIHDHSGHIQVESKPGDGTVFRVLLPIVEELKSSDLEKPVVSNHFSEGKSQHIIVVDDEEAIGHFMKVLLENYKYQVSVFSNGEQAMSVFMKDPDVYDLVITDQTMPVMNGEELARSMLQVRPDLPIILCTGYSQYVDENYAKNIGVRAFLRKPIDTNDIVSKIDSLLN